MNICIDIGNTNAKAGIFEGDELLEDRNHLTDRGIIKLIKEINPENVLIGSVRKGIGKIIQNSKKISDTLVLEHTTRVPFQNNYNTPETLGLDRIAAVAAGQHLYPEQNCLIVDIGTCITYDFIDGAGVYQGGGIAPGVDMRFKAMHKFTSKLPKIALMGNPVLVGKTTKECLMSGVYFGIITEIEGIIFRYRQFFGDLTIIFCGGSANFFESKIKEPIFAIPNLVLVGLNRILRYNLND